MEIHHSYRVILTKEVNLDFVGKKERRKEGKEEGNFKNCLYHLSSKCPEVHRSIFKMSPNLCSINVNEFFFYPVILNALGNAFSLFHFFLMLRLSFMLCLSFGTVCPT